MGRSGKPDIGYRFADHAAYLGRSSISWSCATSPWSGTTGAPCSASTCCSAGPMSSAGSRSARVISTRSPAGRHGTRRGDLFSRLRTPGLGEQLVLQENFFVEQVLPAGMNRHLTPAEHDAYREPFRTPHDRLPILRWIQQIRWPRPRRCGRRRPAQPRRAAAQSSAPPAAVRRARLGGRRPRWTCAAARAQAWVNVDQRPLALTRLWTARREPLPHRCRATGDSKAKR